MRSATGAQRSKEGEPQTYRRILVVLAGTADAPEFAEGRGDAPPLRRGGGRSAALAVGSMHRAAHLMAAAATAGRGEGDMGERKDFQGC